MKQKKNFKKIVLIVGIILLLISLIGFIFYLQYRKTDTFQLSKLGYTKEEITLMKEKKVNLNLILKEEKINILSSLLNEKYYLSRRLERYINYYKQNKEKSSNEVVRMVNANRDKENYTDVKEVYGNDITILTNRYYKLEENFLPTDLVDMNLQFAYDNQKIRQEVNTAYMQMAKAAKEENITLIVGTSYRRYEKQEEIYDSTVRKNGQSIADTLVAKAGHSEHQTGLALDIFTYGSNEEFESSNAYLWLKENCYKYGFIERYPKDAEEITGFSYEPWHYRYVGDEIAKIIHEENITFDEYYTYYIEQY